MIYWDLILKSEDVCGELERMYSQMSLEALAKHLGVSKDTLRKKLILCKIKIRTQGGSYPRISRDDLPVDAHKMDVAQLAACTGYTEQYCRKLRTRLRRENEQRKAKKGRVERKNKGA